MRSGPPIVAATLAVSVVLLQGPQTASAQESLAVSFETTPAGGNYAPENIVAVWVESDAGAFIKTLGRWSATRTQHLVAWVAASGQDADAVSGATRANHTGRLSVSWNLLDRNGMPVPNGNYVVRMEVSDRNSSQPDQNNQGTFAFVRDGVPLTQTVQGGGFNNVTMTYSGLELGLCDNGTLDPGETCDPVGSCPTSCPAAEETCVENVLVGAPAQCTAECVERLIETCASGDGCCPAGCDGASDADCGGGGGGADDEPSSDPGPVLTGGCAASGRPGTTPWPLALVLALALALVPRRRRL